MKQYLSGLVCLIYKSQNSAVFVAKGYNHVRLFDNAILIELTEPQLPQGMVDHTDDVL